MNPLSITRRTTTEDYLAQVRAVLAESEQAQRQLALDIEEQERRLENLRHSRSVELDRSALSKIEMQLMARALAYIKEEPVERPYGDSLEYWTFNTRVEIVQWPRKGKTERVEIEVRFMPRNHTGTIDTSADRRYPVVVKDSPRYEQTLSEAKLHIKRTLSQDRFRADAFLEARGIDPGYIPPLAPFLSVIADTTELRMSQERTAFYPVWRLLFDTVRIDSYQLTGEKWEDRIGYELPLPTRWEIDRVATEEDRLLVLREAERVKDAALAKLIQLAGLVPADPAR